MIDKSSARCSLVLSRLSHNNVTKPSFHFFFFYFTILYWFCHTSTWICSPSWTPLPPASLYHPSGSSQCTSPKDPVLNLDWWFISYVILYMFPWHSSKSSHPLPLPESKKLFYTSVSLLLSRIQGYRYHLSKFHIYALLYCIDVFLSGLLHSV